MVKNHTADIRIIVLTGAAYDFLAFIANKKSAFYNVTNGWTGVQPAMKYEYFAPVGTGRLEDWENQGWDKDDAIAYLNAYYANLTPLIHNNKLRLDIAKWIKLASQVRNRAAYFRIQLEVTRKKNAHDE